MRLFRAFCSAVLLWALCFSSANASMGEEVISSFDSRILVQKDSTVLVDETITALVLGGKIRHGIYRDLPRDLSLGVGPARRLSIKILSVSVDGTKFPVQSVPDGKRLRVFLGDKDRLLPTGEHRFSISYAVENALIQAGPDDGFIWNVTGTNWEFPIQKASVLFVLPDVLASEKGGANLVKNGQALPVGEGIRKSILQQGSTLYETTQALAPKEGLQLQRSWPSGSIAFHEPPSAFLAGVQDFSSYLRASQTVFFRYFYCVLILYYFIRALWLRMSKGKTETVIPLFEPPKGLSPAAVGYFAHKEAGVSCCFSAALISLAVKGYVKISKRDGMGDGAVYVLHATGQGTTKLSFEEERLYSELFNGSFHSERPLVPNDPSVRQIFNVFRSKLALEYSGNFYKPDPLSLLGGVVLCFLALALWHGEMNDLALTLHLKTMFVINMVGFGLCLGRTGKGDNLVSKIEGFKLYLSVAEKDRMTMLNAPELTPRVFERYLPYAIALDVVTNWTDCFIGRGGMDDFSPDWCPSDMQGVADMGIITAGFIGGFIETVAGTTPLLDTMDDGPSFGSLLVNSTDGDSSGGGGF